MNFTLIDRKRKAQEMSVSRLCRIADIDRTTYYKLMENPKDAKFSTVCKLAAAVGLNGVERAEILSD